MGLLLKEREQILSYKGSRLLLEKPDFRIRCFFLEYIQFSFMNMGNCVTGATPMCGNVGFRHMEAESHS